MFLCKKSIRLSLFFMVYLFFISCGNDGVGCARKKRVYGFQGVELGMSVDKLRSMDNVYEQKRKLMGALIAGIQIFRFNDSDNNSISVKDGIVTQINVFDFSKNQDVYKKKEELIAEYGDPSFVSEDEGRFVIGWGNVKKRDKGWYAKGNFITAEISKGMTNVFITKGDPDRWHDYSSEILL